MIKILIIVNRKKVKIVLAVVLSIALLITVFNHLYIVPTVNYSFPTKNKIIVIDPGHGGIDPGTTGKSGVSEDKINLLISLKLCRLIEQSGGVAVLTRSDDEGLYSNDKSRIRDKKNEDLRKRNEIINTSGAHVFVSIHLNSFPQSKYYGAQTFYQKGSEESKKLAELIQEELKSNIDNKNHRMTKSIDTIFILKNKVMPGALVECGFLSNPTEERLLQEDKYQDKIAWSIFVGIARFLNDGLNNGLNGS